MEPSSSRNEAPQNSEQVESNKKPVNGMITCPYDEQHKVELIKFNEHIIECRKKTISFYPHSLDLKCLVDNNRYLPKSEVTLANNLLSLTNAPLDKFLSTKPIVLNVADYLATLKALTAFDSDNENSDDDDDDFDDSDHDGDESRKGKRAPQVTSEIEDSEEDEESEDVAELPKRLKYLDLKKKHIID